MTLTRWDPVRDLLNFQERVNRLFQSASDEASLRPRTTCWRPVVDVLETEEGFIFRAELPGVSKENVSIVVEGNRVTLSGVRFPDEDPGRAAYHSAERIHGEFLRSFTIGTDVDAERATARYVDGLLELFLPKARENCDRRISVECLP